MKRIVLFFISLICLFTVKAQNKVTSERIWPQSGAKWSYCVFGWGGEPVAKQTWGVKGDSLINGVRYEIIGMLDGNRDLAKPILLTRCHNDTVFRYVNDKEYPYFKFDLDIGDVFTTFRSAGLSYNTWNDSACSSKLPLLVYEKGTLNINGVELNRYLLVDTLFFHLYGIDNPPVYELVERIGVTNAYPFINTEEETGCSLTTDFPTVEVFEYEDDTYSFDFSVCEVSTVSENTPGGEMEVFPNPFQDQFTIHCDDETVQWVRVYDALGQLVLEKEWTENVTQINLSGYAPGVYHILLGGTSCHNNNAIKI